MRPRIPDEIARRVDRLAWAAHAFHRYAHHPLCERYAGEVLRAGRRARICRGCALAVGGGTLGLVAGLARPLGSPGAWAAVAVAIALLAASAVWRLPKSAGRGLPALVLGLGAVSTAGTALAAAGVIGAAWFAYRRRGPNRAPCLACPERGERVCSGFAPIVRRERAFRRRAAALLP